MTEQIKYQKHFLSRRRAVLTTLLFVVVLLFSLPSTAQDFLIKSIEINPENLILHYDLLDTTRNRTYTVTVYSSHDNFMAPLTKISGDAGLEVKPGINRRIIWDARAELGAAFEGEVELEIKGRVYVPFLRFDGFQNIEARKRATPFLVKWSGGSRQNILDFQLWRGNKLAYTFPNIPNTGEYKLTIPASVKPGSDYYLKIADTKNKDQVVLTPRFELRRKIPLGVKVIAVLGIGYVAYTVTRVDESPKPIDPAPGTP